MLLTEPVPAQVGVGVCTVAAVNRESCVQATCADCQKKQHLVLVMFALCCLLAFNVLMQFLAADVELELELQLTATTCPATQCLLAGGAPCGTSPTMSQSMSVAAALPN